MKRLGDEPVNARIVLHLKWAPARYKVSQQLARLIGVSVDTHAAVLMTLYKYIKVGVLSEGRALGRGRRDSNQERRGGGWGGDA